MITFNKATDEQLQHAAKFAGLDEMGAKYMDVIEKGFFEPEPLTKKERELLAKGLTKWGYTGIVEEGNFIKAVKA